MGVERAELTVGHGAILGVLADRLAGVPDGPAIIELVRMAVDESEARYRSLFENLEAGFCVIRLVFDAEGRPTDYRFLEVNRAFEAQTGLKGAAGRWMRQLAPDHEQYWFDLYGQVALTGESIRFEQSAAALGDRWFDVHAFPIGDPSGHLVAVLFTDISERRRTEIALQASEEAMRRLNANLEERVAERSDALLHTQEALRQSQKLEAMGQLTGGVAHDFNNLLTPIIGGLDVLRRREVGGPREQRLIEAALQSADRAKTLVQRLLAFARRQPLQPAPVDVAGLIHGLTDLIGSTLGPQIRIGVHVADDLPAALADANQLEMALLNLAVNARDAMPDGGALTISAGVEAVAGEHRAGLAPGDYVRLSVADTGVGMPDEVRSRAIEPFFSTKGVGKGTGLGLSMVHGLTVQLGGGLAIESVSGQGTAVELWLPVSAGDAALLEPPAAPAAIRASGRVLLVDDDALVRMSTADMLGELGYQVVEATSAEEALAMMRDGLAADLLVTDHLMPGMTGADLVRELRILRPALPALVISGYAEADGIAPDLPRLTKPFRVSDLADGLAGLSPVV